MQTASKPYQNRMQTISKPHTNYIKTASKLHTNYTQIHQKTLESRRFFHNFAKNIAAQNLIFLDFFFSALLNMPQIACGIVNPDGIAQLNRPF
jgi:hypothetical protein